MSKKSYNIKWIKTSGQRVKNMMKRKNIIMKQWGVQIDLPKSTGTADFNTAAKKSFKTALNQIYKYINQIRTSANKMWPKPSINMSH